MLALIIVVCIAAITALGTNAHQTFGNVSRNSAGGALSAAARRPYPGTLALALPHSRRG